MAGSEQLRIWHVGNWCIHIGQKYVESPFEAPSKDVEVLNYAQPFVDALRAIPGAEVISQPSWELYHMSPEAFDERLNWATTIIFADVETKCLMLHPDFFQRAKWGDDPITFPDRFELLRDWVAAGGHFHMNGGWLSFSGELGKGGWGRSRFHDVLPVVCLQTDDLVESTAGYEVRCKAPKHPMTNGLDWTSPPLLLGFNECALRDDSECIVEIGNGGQWYPLLASRTFGEGRVTCWTTGASPHWGINFMKWRQYGQFWKQVFSAK
jgi:uncharacterized membrane protein